MIWAESSPSGTTVSSAKAKWSHFGQTLKLASVTTRSPSFSYKAFTTQGCRDPHTFIATHPKANHPHCSHYDSSSSFTDLLIITAPVPQTSLPQILTPLSHKVLLASKLSMRRAFQRFTQFSSKNIDCTHRDKQSPSDLSDTGFVPSGAIGPAASWTVIIVDHC